MCKIAELENLRLAFWKASKGKRSKTDCRLFQENLEENLDILRESVDILGTPLKFGSQDLALIDGYAGRGYAKSRPEELASIRLVAKTEGIILDPVYSGKAMHGLLTEIRKGVFAPGQRILFIHTGGLFGVFHFLTGADAPFGAVK